MNYLKIFVLKRILLLLLLSSCNIKEHKYEIKGKIYVPTSRVKKMYNAIWFTDIINFDGDTLYYFNSDGSEVRINPPFTIKILR